jgi:hypothetical protein
VQGCQCDGATAVRLSRYGMVCAAVAGKVMQQISTFQAVSVRAGLSTLDLVA